MAQIFRLPSARIVGGFRIYMIRSLVTGATYIGKTGKNIRLRMTDHAKDAKKFNRPLHAALNKHGADQFTVTMLIECDSADSAYAHEQRLIKLLQPTLNLSDGGKGRTGIPLTEAQKQKMFAGRQSPSPLKGKKRPDWVIEKIRAGQKRSGVSLKKAASARRNFLIASQKNCRPVWCLETGEFWKSITDCRKHFGKANGSGTWLKQCLDNSNRTFAGFHFVSHVG